MRTFIKIQFMFVAIACLLIVSCEEAENYIPTDQPVYFEYSYINMAWGFQHHGWVIDMEGNVRSYDKPENWLSAGEDGLDYDDLLTNISQADSIIATIDSAVLSEKIQLIMDAKDGKISPLVGSANDAGSSVLSAIYFDEATGKYKSVLLAQSGDFERHNKSRAAESLTEWLKEFDVFWLD
ncbi:hypothetical protein ACFLRQ_03245 [Bacteroidota bacterium]